MKQSNNHNRPALPYYTNNESVPFYTGPEYEFLDNDFDAGYIHPSLYYLGHAIHFDGITCEDVPAFLDSMCDVLNLYTIDRVTYYQFDDEQHPDWGIAYTVTDSRTGEVQHYAVPWNLDVPPYRVTE